MKKERVCLISNIAPSYRAAIYGLMESEFDMEWVFGVAPDGIKCLDCSKFSKVNVAPLKNLLLGLHWQKGVVGIVRRNSDNTIIMLGEVKNLSTWIALMMHKVLNSKGKLFLWSHGWYGREGFFKRVLKRVYFAIADGTLLYGNYARQVAISQGNDGKKLKVIHNSLDYDTHLQLRAKQKVTNVYSQHFNNSLPNVIFLGRLTTIKRLGLVLEAAEILEKDGFGINVVFVGDGVERENLEIEAQQRHVRVWFYGKCYDEMKNAELLYNADVCVAPGNVGLTAIHSMSFGVPVITHDNFKNQMPEFEAIKTGKTGDFFKEEDAYDLARVIKKWTYEIDDREEIRSNCYQEIEEGWNPDMQMRVLRQLLK